MTCPTREQILAVAAGDATPEERRLVEPHIADSCPSCVETLRSVDALRSVARSEVLEDPPSWVLSKAAGIPGLEPAGRWSALAARLAALVFDSVRDPLPHGARSSGTEVRQMLYRVDDYDIDIRIAPEQGEAVRITGQILPGSERPLDDVSGIEVALARDERVSHTSVTNELGEFDLGRQATGDYNLWVGAPEQHLIIGRLPARAS